MRELVEAFFQDRYIANHHIASYNDFLPTHDNPNSRMQAIVNSTSIGDVDTESGLIRLDIGTIEEEYIDIRFGRISLGKPIITEANGARHRLTPMIARMRDATYKVPIYLTFNIIEKNVRGEEKHLEPETDVHIGDLPLMVKCKACNLHEDNIGEGRAVWGDEYNEKLIDHKEDPLDPGAYFIVNGVERALISLEDLAPNRILVEFVERYGTKLEVAKVYSQREGYRALTNVTRNKNSIFFAKVPAASGKIPLIILLKALGMDADQDISDAIISDKRMENIILANLESCSQGEEVFTCEDAIKYLEKRFATGQAKEYRERKINNILDRSLLPHLGTNYEDRMRKSLYLCRMARNILELHFTLREPDDKDHYANKRLKLAGDLMEELFRVSFKGLCRDLKYQLERSYVRKKKIRIRSAIRSDVLTSRMLYALATGNWVGGRAGVSQLLDRTSQMSTLSHLRRVTSPLTRSQPHFEARDLHATQWGRLCPNETPEGQNCGLVKNLALTVDVSEGYSEEKLIDKLYYEMDVEKIGKKVVPDTKIFVNGNLIGIHKDPEFLIEEIKKKRRDATLALSPGKAKEINVRYDDRTNEIFLNCDKGRLRRPLIVVNEGELQLTEKDITDLKEGHIDFQSLLQRGVIEYIDAEEEEDIYVAMDEENLKTFMFEFPMDKITKELQTGKTPDEIIKVFKEDGYSLGKSDYFYRTRTAGPWKIRHGDITYLLEKHDDKFNVYEASSHTHMEMDAISILGVCAGLIPFSAHNSSPRNTMGSAMAKQALGLSSINFKLRIDTRHHVLHYPQRPITQTETIKYANFKHRPAGQNFVVAVISYRGYNMEDALILNKCSVERGLGRSHFMRSYKAEERRYPGGQEDQIEVPPAEVRGSREDAAYDHLDTDGLVTPEEYLTSGDVIIGKTSPPRFLNEQTDFISPQARRDTSITIRHGESGTADMVIMTENEDGARVVKVKVRNQRIPQVGDKFASRHGQKGVVGIVVPQSNMPFSGNGISPDLVINPHAIPSRMTVAHVLEMISGKVGSIQGRFIDGTVFCGEEEETIRKLLIQSGFNHTGKDIMYDGLTGRKYDADIFQGVIYYQKLHHMVADKMHVRSRGPVQILTRQPTEGRARLGGLRFGEMERDTLIGHGASMVIKDRLLDSADGTTEYVCGKHGCGHIAILDRQGNLRCPVCGDGSSIFRVNTSYAFKLLLAELKSLGVMLRLTLEDVK